MHLVDPKMMMQPTITAPMNPIHRSIVTRGDDMRTVLDRCDLSDEEKVRQYNQILQRYLEYHNHLKTPSPPKEANTVKDDEIIRTVPVKFRGKAENLLKCIEQEPTMHWNERGEFVHNGQVIKGSNIVDLVNDVVRQRKDFHPHGWQEFARALRRGNVPQDLVGIEKDGIGCIGNLPHRMRIPRVMIAVRKGERGHVLGLKLQLDEERCQQESNENGDHWTLRSGNHSHK